MNTEDSDKPKSHGRGWRRIWILLVVLTLWGISRAFMKPLHPHPLLDRASVALQFKSSFEMLNDGVPVVATLSDTNWLVGQLDLPENNVFRYKMDRVEFTPQHRSANTRLALVLNQGRILVGDLEPSPDGRWVLGTLLNGNREHLGIPEANSPAWRVVAATDGSRATQWPAYLPMYYNDASSLRNVKGSYLAWMPDSRNVAEILTDQSSSGTLRLEATLHDVTSGRTATLQFSAQGQAERGAQLAIRPDVLLFSSISNIDQAWTSPVRRLLREDEGRETVKPTNMDLYSWPLRHPDVAPRISHLNTPPGTWLVALAFSPDGKRIAWEVVRDNNLYPLERVLDRLLRRPVPAPSSQIEVWTSGIDGSDMEMVGYLPSTEYWDKEYRGTRLHLAWLPSGKGLRFAFEDKIYTVKAN